VIWVFLPAYNEEIALPRLAQKLDATLRARPEGYRIVVLDDGSSDRTLENARQLAKEYPVDVLRHEKNQGLGRTMVDGLEHCAKNSAPGDVIVTLDCDDTHEPSYIPKAIEKIHEGWDVVVLSRYQKGGGEEGLSPIRSILSRGAGLFLKLFFPIRGVYEYSCGYRAFRAEALKKAFDTYGANFVRLAHQGFVVTPEILVKMRMLGARIAEIPFVLQYGQKPGASKNRPLRTIRGYFSLVQLYWGRRIVK
jgi:dolichol-phosphate mannosyltransferase